MGSLLPAMEKAEDVGQQWEPHAKQGATQTGGAGTPCGGIDCWESSKWQIMVA